MSKRAVLYARVSGDDTRNDGRNLVSQLEMCRKYAIEHGYEIVAELHEDDRGASGAAFELEQLNYVRDLARTRAFDVLIVREIDRLSRKLAKQLIIEEELRRAGVAIEYVLASYDDTPEGRLNKHIKATVAEYEREKISERTTRARRMQARDGSVMTHGHRIFGYNLVANGSKHGLAVNEAEAQWVRRVFEWYTLGDENGVRLSIRQIAARLSDLCIPTVADLKDSLYKERGRCQWPVSSVSNILNNETYAGIWHYGRRSAKYDLLSVSVPAIIDPETFQAAQTRRTENREVRRRAPKYDYLMASRLRCSCGYAVGPTGTKKNGSRLYYNCAARTQGARLKKCDAAHYRRTDVVDRAVWKWVASLLTDEETLTHGLSEYQTRNEKENGPLRERLAAIDGLLVDARAQLAKLLDLYLAGDFPREMLIERKSRLGETISKLEAERKRIETQLEARSLSEKEIQSLHEFVVKASIGLKQADQSFAERKRIIDLLDVHGVFVMVDGQEMIDVECIVSERQTLFLSNNC